MPKLIAIVAVAVYINGERTVVLPGEEVTGLNAVDTAELKRIGSIQDEDEVLADKKVADRLEKAAGAEFAKARKAVQATQAAIEAPPAKETP